MIARTDPLPPSLLWSIEAAMWSAIEHSNLSDEAFGWCHARSEDGSVALTVYHRRYQVPGFAFMKGCKNITPSVLAALRDSAGGCHDSY